jgi:hypothetical protein
MSTRELYPWVIMGMSLLIGVSIYLYVRWNDRKYGKPHKQ